MTITIGEFTFPTKEAAKAAFQAVLYRDELDTEIVGDDARLAEALLCSRPEKLREIGDRTVVRFSRKAHRNHSTPCIFAELDDGTVLDISFTKLINAFGRSTAPAASA